jgi:hypothetical protein
MTGVNRSHGIMAGFEDPEQLLNAARRAHTAGYRKMDAYSPFPIEGLAQALGHKQTGVAFLFLMGGIAGALGGYFMLWYSMAVDWPMNIGGRPLNSWPMYVPITFELTILCSSLLGFVGTLALCRFPEPYHPVFNVPEFSRASRDRFFLCIETSDPKFEASATLRFLEGLDPYYLEWVEQ